MVTQALRIALCTVAIVVAATVHSSCASAQIDLRISYDNRMQVGGMADDMGADPAEISVCIVNLSKTESVEGSSVYANGGVLLYAATPSKWPISLAKTEFTIRNDDGLDIDMLDIRKPRHQIEANSRTFHRVDNRDAARKHRLKRDSVGDFGPQSTHTALVVNAANAFLTPDKIQTVTTDGVRQAFYFKWGWQAQPTPPYSPFAEEKGDERVLSTVVWAELNMGNRIIRSRPILVRLDQLERPPKAQGEHATVRHDSTTSGMQAGDIPLLEPPVVLGFKTAVISSREQLDAHVGSLVTIRGKVFANKEQTILGVHIAAPMRLGGKDGYASGILSKFILGAQSESFQHSGNQGDTQYVLYSDLKGTLAGAKAVPTVQPHAKKRTIAD